MKKFLSWWAQVAFTHKWAVISVWIVLLGVVGFLGIKFMEPTTSTISIPGTEAQKTLERYKEQFPSGGNGTSRIVFAANNDKSLVDYESDIASLLTTIKDVDGVTAAYSPFDTPGALSDDSTIGYATVQLEGNAGSVSEETSKKVETAIDDARTDNLQIEYGGDLISQVPGEILGVGEIGGVVIALIVLVITLGSLVAAGLPLIIAIVTIGVSMAGLFALSGVIEISATTPVLAVMLGLAVGIDYSLFIINRYKVMLLEGYSHLKAVSGALAEAGTAVLYAAGTVVIALAALAVVQIPFMTNMGFAAAATVALAAIAAVTLIPALLGLTGKNVFGRKTRKVIEEAQKQGVQHTEHVSHKTFWFKWGRLITRRPIITLAIAVVIAGTIAIPALDLKLGLPLDQYASEETTQRKAYDLMTKGFGVGTNAPLLILVEGLPQTSDEDRETVRTAAMAEYEKQVASARAEQEAYFAARQAQVRTPGDAQALQQEVAAAQQAGAAAQAQALEQIESQVTQYAPYVQLQQVGDRIADVDGVESVQPVAVTDEEGDVTGVLQVIPSTAPGDIKTDELIAYLRDTSNNMRLVGETGASLGVTGSTALQIDINDKLAKALPLYLSVVIGLSFVLLVVAFRSILIPIKATLGFLLSVAAMFGAMVAVYQWDWLGLATAPGPIISFLPIISIGILFGLAMDYEFFLVSSMHEAHQHTRDAKKAVYRGFSIGSKVVTAAAVIMVSVFAGFISNHDTTIQAMGFGLAFGILIDAFLVRLTIVPAVMTLLGEAAWWPFGGKSDTADTAEKTTKRPKRKV